MKLSVRLLAKVERSIDGLYTQPGGVPAGEVYTELPGNTRTRCLVQVAGVEAPVVWCTGLLVGPLARWVFIFIETARGLTTHFMA